MSKEALRLALDALEKCDSALSEELAAWDIDPPLHHVLDASNACGPAITALREALAEQKSGIKQVIELYDSPDQPSQQEPVANYCKECLTYNGHHEGCSHHTSPPAQRTWVGLTDEERHACTQSPFTTENYRAIEAKLKEKNT